jgi:UDP-3-O-[3-hydroxymyristoyl] glucosamine N-acyltransferase
VRAPDRDVALGELAERFGLTLRGDADCRIRGVCTLRPGVLGCIGFLANPRYRSQLQETRASAVILAERDAEGFAGNALVAKDPYLAFARVARLFMPAPPDFGAQRHESAVVHPDARLAEDVALGPNCVVGPGSELASGVRLGPNCVVGANVRIGADSELVGSVNIADGVRMGARCRLHPGVVIGARGFGLARGPEGWEEVPQLGSVVIGDDVEIGANSAVDRGAIEDTVIADGVKIDNLVQIAHNVRIGRNTAIAGCAAIAGSTHIGAHCMIGGGVGVNGHIRICDGVVILGFSMVTHSIEKPGQYGSGWPLEPARVWHGQLRRLRRLDRLEARVAALESGAGAQQGSEQDQGERQ